MGVWNVDRRPDRIHIDNPTTGDRLIIEGTGIQESNLAKNVCQLLNTYTDVERRLALIENYRKEQIHFSKMDPATKVPADVSFRHIEETAQDVVDYCKDAKAQLQAGCDIELFEY